MPDPREFASRDPIDSFLWRDYAFGKLIGGSSLLEVPDESIPPSVFRDDPVLGCCDYLKLRQDSHGRKYSEPDAAVDFRKPFHSYGCS